MAKNHFDSDQMVHRTALAEFGHTSGEELLALLPKMNNRVREPFSLSLSGLVVSIGDSVVVTGPDGKNKGVPQLDSVDLGLLSGSASFVNGPGGAVVVTGAVATETIPAMTSNYYIRAGFEVRKDKNISVVFGTEGSSAANAGSPGFSTESIQLGEITLQENGAGGFVSPSDQSVLTQFGVGAGGGGSGSGLGFKNYVINYDAELNISNVTASGATIETTEAAGEVLNGDQSFKATFTDLSDTVDFEMDPVELSDRGKAGFWQFAYKLLTGNDDDLIVSLVADPSGVAAELSSKFLKDQTAFAFSSFTFDPTVTEYVLRIQPNSDNAPIVPTTLEQTTVAVSVGINASLPKAAQSFDSKFTEVDSITLEFAKFSTGTNFTGNGYCRIYEDNSGEPGTLVATSTDFISIAELNALGGIPAWTSKTFNFGAMALDKNKKYWFEIDGTEIGIASELHLYVRSSSNTNPYANGNLAQYNGSAWFDLATFDLGFTLVGQAADTAVNLEIALDNVIVRPASLESTGGDTAGLNYTKNPSLELDEEGWESYNNEGTSPGSNPSGGTISSDWTVEHDTSTAIRGTGGLKISKGASDVQGHGVVALLDDLAEADYGRFLVLTFDYKITGTYFNDIGVYLCTGSQEIEPIGTRLLTDGSGQAQYIFKAPASAPSSFKVAFHQIKTTTNTYELLLDRVILSPFDDTQAITTIEVQDGHGFSVENLVWFNGTQWEKATATKAGFEPSAIGMVVRVIGSDRFQVLWKGKWALNSVSSGAQYYLGQSPGTFSTSSDWEIVVPVFTTSNEDQIYFDPDISNIKRLQTNPSTALYPYRYDSGSILVQGGGMSLGDGTYLYSGSSTDETASNRDKVINISSLVPAPAVGAWYVYADRNALTLTTMDKGTRAYLWSQDSELSITQTPPDQIDSYRYIHLFGLSVNTNGHWSDADFVPRAERVHDSGINMYTNVVEKQTVTVTSATTGNAALNFAGIPQVQVMFWDASESREEPLVLTSHILGVSASQVDYDTSALTFDTGDEVRIHLTYTKQQTWQGLNSPQTQFESSWFTSNGTTVVPHGLPDASAIRGAVVLEHNTSTNRHKVLSGVSTPLADFDDTNIYLDWTGFSPSATLRYKVITGGHPNPFALPKEIGGYTMFVGFGPGSYSTLSAALAVAQPGDSILVNRSETITSGGIFFNIDDLRIDFMPGVKFSYTDTGIVDLMTIQGDNNVINNAVLVNDGGESDSGFSLIGENIILNNAKVEVINSGEFSGSAFYIGGDGYHFVRGYVKVVSGTVPNLVGGSANDIASSDVMVRG